MRRTALLLVLTLLAGLSLSVGLADGTTGSFEVDGNTTDDSGPGEPIDWATPPPNVASFTDLASSSADDSFALGSKETEPGAWVCATGGVPSKDDIGGGAVALRIVGGKQFIHVNWRRVATHGDAHIDYEFNQSAVPNPSCPALPTRTNGDILMSFDTEQGGKKIIFQAFSWTFTGPGIGTFTPLPVGSEHTTWDAAVNIPPSLSDVGVPPGAFGEASLNLTDTPVGEFECGEFGAVHMKSRASSSIEAALKDRTTPQPLQRPDCPPILDLRKAADAATVAEGGTITYTLTYSNRGGVAPSATITEQIPAGTAFVSCTGGCTVSGGTATWQVGPIPPGGGGSVTLTVRVLPGAGCLICNVATISTDGQTASSNQVCVQVVPVANLAGAHAHDSALGVRVQDSALALDQTLVSSSSARSGLGTTSDADHLFNVAVPGLAAADVVRTTSSSSVVASPVASAAHTSTAETVNVNLLGGVVTAGVVRGVASTTATGSSAAFSSAGSSFKDLFVDVDGPGPQPAVGRDDVGPNTRIDLSAVFGAGSFVVLREETGSTSGPPPGTLSGGTYAADLAVNMIHVHVTDRDPLTPGNQTTDVIVSQAVAHSDFPQTTLCEAPPGQAVSGHAFILSESTSDPSVAPTAVGFVAIPPSGGSSHQHLDAVAVPTDSPAASAEVSDSDSTGTLAASASSASSYAQATNPCLLAGMGCAIGATAVRSQANSTATASGAGSTDTGTVLVDAVVLGIPVGGTPPPNTTITLPGIGFVILNEQFCDGGAPLASGCAGATASGRTVRAIRVVVTMPGNPTGLAPGTEIIVAEAHADASFVS